MVLKVVTGKPESTQPIIELGNRLALLVGINKYDDSIISDLNFSVKDIKDFYEILIDPKRGKYRTHDVVALSDTHDEKPIRNNILSKLTTMSRIASPKDSILLYFSGHGLERNEKPYRLCSDSYSNTLEETAIPIELMRKIMADSPARIKIVVIDACHSGAIKGVKDSGIMTKSFYRTFFPAPEGFVVLTSCKLGEYSYEWNEKEHSVFSYYLLEGIKGPADKDNDGIITISDAYKYTSEKVKRWAFSRGYEQSPFLDAKISGDIPLTFTEETIEKEEEFDKTIVGEIILKSEPWDSRDEAIENMCGSLLNLDVEASKIEKVEGKVRFPYGTLEPEWKRVSGDSWGYWIFSTFMCSKKNWKKIDEIIDFFGEKYYWREITYRINRILNMEKLVKKCKENAFQILSYNPEKKKESMVVNTEAWLSTKTTFRNYEDHSTVQISMTEIDDSLPTGFYSTLSPENIIEFLKDCFVRQRG